LEYKGFFGSIEYSPRDNDCHGHVLGIPGNVEITCEGEDETGLVRDFRDGVDSYLEHCKERGINPYKSHTDV
jgi:predicted HicB family RNase H-like nuclease